MFWLKFQVKKCFTGSTLVIVTTVSIAVGEDALPVPVFPAPIPMNVPGANFPNGLILDEGDLGLDGEGVDPPEIAAPHAPAQPSAIIVRWDNYRTLIVIDASAGLIKSCWIVTLATAPQQVPAVPGGTIVARNQVVVFYRGQAYFDKDKILHIDARRARIGGALAQGWSPDSFSITPDKKVTTTDDRGNPSNSGDVEKIVPADTQAAEYRKLMFTAQTIVEGNI
jgi:hypothetical protein